MTHNEHIESLIALYNACRHYAILYAIAMTLHVASFCNDYDECDETCERHLSIATRERIATFCDDIARHVDNVYNV